MRGIKIAGKSLLLILIGVIIGTVFLCMAYLLPVNQENRNILLEQIGNEGWYPRTSNVTPAYDAHFHSFYPDVLDGSSDTIMISTSTDDAEGSPLFRAMASHSETMGNYSYYWHGYVSVLRPLLLFLDLTELRILNGICQLFLMFLLAYKIGSKKGIRYVCMLVSSYVLVMPFAVNLSLQFSWVFYIGMAGTFVLLSKHEFLEANSRYIYFFLVLGMLTSYFDLLTYPLFTWGVPLVWWLVMDDEPRTKGQWCGRVVATGLGWIAGYAFMWVMKWILATPVLGHNVFEEALNEVFFRSGALENEIYGLAGRLNAVYINWRHYEYKAYAILLAGWLLWWFLHIAAGKGTAGAKRHAYFLVGISSFVWYFVLANHTQIHHFFTYRIFGVTILAFLAMALDSVSKDAARASFRKRVCVWVFLGIAVCASVPLAFLAREELFVVNGEEEFIQIPLEQGRQIKVSFTPAFRVIKHLGLGLECSGTQGQYLITLWRDDVPEYQTTIPVGKEGNMQNFDIDQELDRNHEYLLTVEVQDNDAPVDVWVTANGAMPLTEFGTLNLNGQSVEGQLLTGITYWCKPVSKMRLLFLAGSWTGLLMAAGYAFLGDRVFSSKSELPLLLGRH